MRRSFPLLEHLIHSFDSFTQFTIIRILKSHIMCRKGSEKEHKLVQLFSIKLYGFLFIPVKPF